MIKQLKYSDRDLIIEVIKSRDHLFSSSSNTPVSLSFIENIEHFNINYCFGYFIENELDAFIFVNIWTEVPVYSTFILTKKRPNREKNEFYTDKSLSELVKYARTFMMKLGYFEQYEITAAESWVHPKVHKQNITLVDTVEIIPAGELSNYPLFRQRLMNRRSDIPLKITRFTVLPEFRPNV